MSDSWSNEEPLNIRQRIATLVLLLCVQLIDPYKFKHEYQDEFKDIKKLIIGKVKGK